MNSTPRSVVTYYQHDPMHVAIVVRSKAHATPRKITLTPARNRPHKAGSKATATSR